VQHHDHGAAVTIFANRSYFVDTPCILQVFKKSLRKIFGTKKDVVSGWIRTLYSEELMILYMSSSTVIVNSRRLVSRARIRETRIAYRILLGKSFLKTGKDLER
jgi:hypothetical protein